MYIETETLDEHAQVGKKVRVGVYTLEQTVTVTGKMQVLKDLD